jgi:hypothetical protein
MRPSSNATSAMRRSLFASSQSTGSAPPPMKAKSSAPLS